MESRLGVRAADAKTLPHYHYMDLSNRITRIHPTTSFLAGQLCWGWGQKDRRHLNHWSGSPPDRSVRALRRSCLYSAMQSATRRVWLRLPAKGEVAALPAGRRNAASSAFLGRRPKSTAPLYRHNTALNQLQWTARWPPSPYCASPDYRWEIVQNCIPPKTHQLRPALPYMCAPAEHGNTDTGQART